MKPVSCRMTIITTLSIVVVIGVVQVFYAPTIHAYVNNGNTVASSKPPSISILDWLPKNAFLPKANLHQVQEQLMHIVLNLQLDMETTKGAVEVMVDNTGPTMTLDPEMEFAGWNTNHKDHSTIRTRTTKPIQKEVVKSSHLLLQRSNDATPRLPIRNLQFMLGSTAASTAGMNSILTKESTNKKTKSKNHPETSTNIPMPGYNGAHPSLSSGVVPLTIHNCGEYVTLDKGVQSLPLSTTATAVTLPPQWEVIWKEQSPTGTIVCGIELPQPIRRNADAMIPAGIMYISFPVWDGAQLLEYQKKKVEYDITSKLYSQERDLEIEKMTKSNNIFNKLMHYRNAFAAAENYSLQPHKAYRNVPTTLDDLIAIESSHDDAETSAFPPLYIVPKGMVRIVPAATMKQMTQTSPCGSKAVMNRMLWSSSSSGKNEVQEAKHPNDILHGTAKIVPPPAVPLLRSPPTEVTTTSTTTPLGSSSSSSITDTDSDTTFM